MNFVFPVGLPCDGICVASLSLFECSAWAVGSVTEMCLTVGMCLCPVGDDDVVCACESAGYLKECVEYATSSDSECNDSGCARAFGSAEASESTVAEIHVYAYYTALNACGCSLVEVILGCTSCVSPLGGITMGVLKACRTEATVESECAGCGVHMGLSGRSNWDGDTDSNTST